MNKKTFTIILAVFVLITLNICAAQEIENITAEDVVNTTSDSPVLGVTNDTQPLEAASVNTKLEVESTTDFDVIGDYFKVKLTDANNNVLKNTKVSFTVDGKSYNKNTDSLGIASLQLRLNDGSYNIVTKFAGNANYKASSLTTKITMDNTREIESGMSNAQIQKIIDDAKPNNVILFKGSSYSNINLAITKCLTLQSNVQTTLKSTSSSPVITIKGSKASLTKVKGFKIEGSGDGIYINGADYVTIYGNDITANNGIVALNTKYLNITKNNIVKNSKSGIVIAESSYSYIFNNKVSNNKVNGIEVAKSNNVYIHGNTIVSNVKNGIHLSKTVNGVNYGQGPYNVQINKNTISRNEEDGIYVQNVGDNLDIKSNTIEANQKNGISLAHVGDIVIQSNVIKDSWENGIRFFDLYERPNTQIISYNAIYGNYHMDVEAKETYFQENGVKLDVGDNWYTDYAGICPKINSNNIKFSVKQIGPNKYQAVFTDSNGNVASLLPDRTLTYTTNGGQQVTITIRGGAGVFTVDANDNDLVQATVDNSRRDNRHDVNTKNSNEINGKSPEYSYPGIPQYELYDDIGSDDARDSDEGQGNGQSSGNGQGNGQGNGGSTGSSQQGSGDNVGNGTLSQNMDPASGVNNQPNQVSQANSAQTTSQAGASNAGNPGGAGSDAQSVVKQIIIDEDEFFKITGISFIILLMILTIGFYYRDDIMEMKSKM